MPEQTFTELQDKAKAMNIAGWHSMNKAQLIIATAENREDSEVYVYDRTEKLSEADMKEIKEQRSQTPSKTIMWKKDQDLVMEIINRNPYAFNNTNLTDQRARIQHHFQTSNKSRKVLCFCGEKFKIQGEWEESRPNPVSGKMERMPVTGQADRRYCPNKKCNRLHIYHGWDNLPPEQEM
jgi:hypothetical protein